MATVLQQLAKITDVVADTGDIAAIKKHQPVDATTNPSLLLKAFSLSDYQTLVGECKVIAKSQTMAAACDYFAVKIGVEILASIPGKISTEVDARLSFDTPASINRARQLIALYQSFGIDKNRVLIKLAATWEGICAAQVLEREGINCNLTLLFSFAQAQACAEAGVFLISPFVGRILDWHKAQNPELSYNSSDDPGVLSVKRIYQYYKQHDYSTVVMGASFRNIGQVMALAGCDKLTVAPNLLDELKQLNEPLMQQLSPEQKQSGDDKQVLTQAEFRMAHNDDAMATEKLAQGIRAFIVDQEKLEFQLSQG